VLPIVPLRGGRTHAFQLKCIFSAALLMAYAVLIDLKMPGDDS